MIPSSVISPERKSGGQILVYMRGGLGNQMFQYAAGRALALANRMKLVLDTVTGFSRDKVYRRSYLLGKFPIQAEGAGLLDRFRLRYERGWNRCSHQGSSSVTKGLFSSFLMENELRYLDEVSNHAPAGNICMDGHWQCEDYFEAYRDVIARELTPPVPEERQFLSLAVKMRQCNSVAVGVRLFEDIPGRDKSGVGGLVPFSFYDQASVRVATKIQKPVFYVFCTKSSAVDGKLKLPGVTNYITCDEGFADPVQTLWLMTQCHHHILSNSSFYWWGAWLSEHREPDNVVISCDLFPNQDTVPSRWERLSVVSEGH